MKQLLATLFAAALACAASAETLGSRLDRMNELKGRTELARQERALQEELLRAGAASLPTVVSISGRSENLVARLQVNATSQRNFSLGDSVGGGFTIVSILPQEVLVGRPAGKGGEIAKLALAFAQPEVNGKAGSPATPNMPPVPALPAAMSALQPPAQR
jgi:hypothetical protein